MKDAMMKKIENPKDFLFTNKSILFLNDKKYILDESEKDDRRN